MRTFTTISREGRGHRPTRFRRWPNLETLELRLALSATALEPAIRGTTFVDANRNGALDAGEALPGVTVRLFRDNGDGVFDSAQDQQFGTDNVTGTDGTYCFDGFDNEDGFFVQQPAQTVGNRSLLEQVTALLRPGRPTLLIDDFAGSQQVSTVETQLNSDGNSTLADVLGGERDLRVFASRGQISSINVNDGRLGFSSTTSAGIDFGQVVWDGIDDDPINLAFGLDNIDLTNGGTNTGFYALGGADVTGTMVTIFLFDGTTFGDDNITNQSSVSFPLPQISSENNEAQLVFVPFTSLSGSVQPNAVRAIGTLLSSGDNPDGAQLFLDSFGVGGPLVADFATESSGFDVRVLMSDGETTAVAGANLTYEIVVTNDGPEDAADVRVATTLPDQLLGVMYTSVATSEVVGNTLSGVGSIDDSLFIPSGTTITYTLNATVASSASGSLSSQVDISAEGDLDPFNNISIDTDVLLRQADVSVTKTDGRDFVSPGDVVTYVIVVENAGPSDVSQVEVTDLLPGSLTDVTFVSESFGGALGATLSGDGDIDDTVLLPVGSSIIYTVTATVRDDTQDAFVENVATVTLTVVDVDPDLSNNQASDIDELTTEIRGRVFSDLSGDGITADDDGLSGVTVELFLDDGDNQFDALFDALVDTTTSDAAGDYDFAAVRLGDYFVRQIVPDGFVQTVGGANGETFMAVVVDGPVLASVDFADAPLGFLSGNVFDDESHDGSREATEEARAAWTVSLLDPQGEILTTTQTDANGNYEFRDVPPGEYTVVAQDPASFEFTSPSPRFADAIAERTAGNLTGPIAVADLNGDGQDEIISASEVPSSIDILTRQDGVYQLNNSISLGTLARPQFVLAEDLDGDGDIDLAVPTLGTPTQPTPQNPTALSNALLIFENNGQGEFTRTVSVAAGHGPVHVASGDLDGDGIVDLVVTNFRGRTIDILGGLGGLNYATRQTIVVGADPMAAAVGDPDGDGDLDLAVAVYGGDEVLLFANDGSGIQRAWQRWNVARPIYVVLGPSASGGDDQLLAISYEDNRVQALDPLGEASTSWQVAANPRSAVLADVNDDGANDLIVSSAQLISILYGTGEGFAEPPFFVTPANPAPGYTPQPQYAAVIDADSDGDLDLAVGMRVGGVTIIENNVRGYDVTVNFGTLQDGLDFGIASLGSVEVRVSSGVLAEGPGDATKPNRVLDVNGDGFITGLDALLVVNYLNDPSHTGLVLSTDDVWLDTNGDGFVSGIDALLIFNHLNSVSLRPAVVDQVFAQKTSSEPSRRPGKQLGFVRTDGLS